MVPRKALAGLLAGAVLLGALAIAAPVHAGTSPGAESDTHCGNVRAKNWYPALASSRGVIVRRRHVSCPAARAVVRRCITHRWLAGGWEAGSFFDVRPYLD